MKKVLFLSITTILVLSLTNSHATIRRVGYSGIQTGNDYTNLDGAIGASGATDTIMLYPGSWSANITKRVILLGYGYDTDTIMLGTAANAGLQAIKGTISVALSLRPGADSSIFEGIDKLNLLNGFFNNNASFFYFNTNNITVRRCRGSLDLRGGNQTHINFRIIQSIVNFKCDGRVVNGLVSNSVITSKFSTSSLSGQSVMLLNNIFMGAWNDINFIFKNNIFLFPGSFPVTSSSTYDYNVFVANITGTINGSNNIINQNKDSIFVGYSTQGDKSNDGRWKLKANSPAQGAGEGGIDCGIYAADSPFPYKPSGIPSIPAFYRLDAPSSTANSSQYKITFSVRSNN